MLYFLKRIFVLVFLCLNLVACEKDNLSLVNFPEDSEVNYDSIELELMNLVNIHRADLGLSKLNRLSLVSNEAKIHTNYMVEKELLSHDNFDLRTTNLIKNIGATKVGENVAYGYQNAGEMLKAWLNSQKHRQVIEGDEYTNFGISAKKNSAGRYYVTQIFIQIK